MRLSQRNILGSIGLVAAFVAVFAVTACGVTPESSFDSNRVFAAHSAELPSLPWSFSVKWDISKKDNLLVQDFIVHKKAAYFVVINFDSITLFYSQKEYDQLMVLLNRAGPFDHRSLVIPVVMKIERIDGDYLVPVLPQKTINTRYLCGWNGSHMQRCIAHEMLSAGKYRITIHTTHAVKLPSNNVETSLMIYTPRRE